MLFNHTPCRRIRTAIAALIFGLAASNSPQAAQAEEVTVFAAASLKTALDEFASGWQQQTGHTVTISYAGSGALASQIVAGAPADIFISANAEWAGEVEMAGLGTGAGRRDILGNTLVLIAHGKDATPVGIGPGLDLAGLLGDGKLAMAMVDAVPAGIYGKAALTSLGLWDKVSPSVAQADNVRAALALVSTGEAPYGIVYATDAAATDNVTVIGTFPPGSHPDIVYPALLLKGAADAADTSFFEALGNDEAEATFARHGFKVLN